MYICGASGWLSRLSVQILISPMSWSPGCEIEPWVGGVQGCMLEIISLPLLLLLLILSLSLKKSLKKM